jgi:hypothetical protein
VPITKEDAKVIADMMVTQIQSTHHNFWIDPQTHYDDHAAMREVVGSWKSAKGIFTRAFIGLVVIGSIVLMGFAAMKGVGK